MDNVSVTSNHDQIKHRTRQYVLWGAVAGLIGGLGFGVIMLLTDMFPMVGRLVQQENPNIGFVVHMLISALFGIIFGAVMGFFTGRRSVLTLLIGFAYGLFWWIVGALVLMPVLLGMPERVFVIEQMQYYSLLGHVIYGLAVSATINVLSA